MSALTRLVDCTIGADALPADGYAVLERLPSLRRLRLQACKWCPASLGSLSRLTALYLQQTPLQGTAAQALVQAEAALAALPQLRHLAIRPAHASMPFPAAVAAMDQLHTLAWVPKTSAPPEPWSPFPALPPGAYLPSLRRLVVPAAMAAPSLGALAAGATRLECLALFSFADASTTEQAALMEVVAGHPTLRLLSMELSGRYACAATFMAVSGALARRPGLRLKVGPAQPLAWDAYDEGPAGLETPWRLPDEP